MDCGHIALQGAVALHGDKAPLGAQPLALGFDHRGVVRVDLRDNHGHIGGAPVGAVVGDDRALLFGVGLLQGADVLLLHIHGAEHKIHLGHDLVHVLFRVVNGHFRHAGRHGDLHGPAAAHSLLIGFPGGAGAGRQCGHRKPGVVFQQGGKTLPHHSRTSDDSHAILFHIHNDPFCNWS